MKARPSSWSTTQRRAKSTWDRSSIYEKWSDAEPKSACDSAAAWSWHHSLLFFGFFLTRSLPCSTTPCLPMQRDLVTVERFYTEHATSLQLHLVAGATGLKRLIREPTVN